MNAIAHAIFSVGGVTMAFSEIIREIRKRLGITQEELAHELSVSFSTINRWENGHRTPKKLAIVYLIEFCKRNAMDEKLIAELEKL